MSSTHLSDEQQQVADIITAGTHNVIVDAVAGSGKTTTIVSACVQLYRQTPKSSILVLTYNRALCESTKQKWNSTCINHRVEIRTFHAFMQSVSKMPCHDDTKLRDILRRPVNTLTISKFTHVIVDECQDLTPEFQQVVALVMNKCPYATYAFFGDIHQCLYEFKGADERFLSLADQVFTNMSTKPWKRCKLSRTFRCPESICAFVNHGLLGHKRLTHSTSGTGTVTYVCTNAKYHIEWIVNDIASLISTRNYTCGDIFVLSFSTESDYRCKKIANTLRERELELNLHFNFVILNQTADSSIDNTHNKIVFSTFHKTKGLERKVVYVLGFNDSQRVTSQCPPEHYVAATRAQERLVLLHDSKRVPLPYLDRDFFETAMREQAINVIGYSPFEIDAMQLQPTTNLKTYKTTVTMITRFKDEILYKATEQFIRITPVAVPGMKDLGENALLRKLPHAKRKITEVLDTINGNFTTIAAAADMPRVFVHTAVLPASTPNIVKHILKSEGHYFRKAQLGSLNWIDKATRQQLVENCRAVVAEVCGLEESVKCEHDVKSEVIVDDTAVTIQGRIDFWNEAGNLPIEIKTSCSNECTNEQVAQVVIYMHAVGASSGYLVNSLRGRAWLIEPLSASALESYVQTIARFHISSRGRASDAEFIKSVQQNLFCRA